MNSKGMEMAIQIFIVLFVLLAVSMLVLQLVSQQFTSNQDQLVKQQREQQFNQQKKEFQTECSALLSSGKAMHQAEYCVKRFSLTEESSLISNYFDTEFGLVGFCDDAIYCFVIDQTIKPIDCVDAVCVYLKDMGADKNQANITIKNLLSPGNCKYENEPLHWYNLSLNKTAPSCDHVYK